MIWTAYFLKGQGVHVSDSILFQDNMSAILLEKNGRASAGKRSRHMNIRYFFIADQAKSGEVRIEYCPTEEMLGDFFTKPVQGGQFYFLRDGIMNIDPQSKYHSDRRSVLSHESHDDELGTQGCNDDVTPTDVATNVDVRKRRSYLEVLMQRVPRITL